MAEPSFAVAQDQLSCQICLDLLKDPVTIPCGHSYCTNCISDYWGTGKVEEGYSCPHCRQTFDSMPFLGRNTILAEMVERLKMAEVPQDVPEEPPDDNCYAGPGDVSCDFCIGKKLKAIKSCLACLASYCEAHILPHLETPRLKKHKLVPATAHLEEQLCVPHDKLLEVFCCTDKKLICIQCAMDEHKGHDIVPIAKERAERQQEFGKTQDLYQQRIQEREKELQELKGAMDTLKHSAQAAVEENERMFNLLIHSIERRRTEMKELIRVQERTELGLAEGLLEKLEKEIGELKKRDAELAELAQTEDHVRFLQSYQSLCATPPPEDIPQIPVHQSRPLADLKRTISYLKETIDSFCTEELVKVYGSATYVHLIPEPRAKDEYLQYCGNFTMDLNTANNCLCLSEGCKEASNTMKVQSYPNHPERFLNPAQVLCKEAITGRCYWEVEWSGESGVGLAVSYKNISRKGSGSDSKFGSSINSWRLRCSPSKYMFKHSNEKIEIPIPDPVPSSNRVGVYVDHRAGVLAFFSVADMTMSLLHRVQTRFSQPLYPGFLIHMNSKVKFYQKSLNLHPLCSLPNCG
ncbi:tripartite motif-containing protein 16-like [Alosa sapidissima]|uniref:tripartite motif-containing protein 16-like n=1 Tax=Alosa sapidissima TaxID=34773 RepID=UPI001C090180|nr:tripartite motif-containing protein 16-like [Alosa sapidissima]